MQRKSSMLAPGDGTAHVSKGTRMTLSQDQITHAEEASPRRDALRTIGIAGAALLGLNRLTSTAAEPDTRAVKGEKQRKHRKQRKKKACACSKIGLTSAESAPFTVGANQGVTRQANCPAGFIAISGGLEGVTAVTAPCMIRESHVDPSGSAWIVNVFCTEATNTPLLVGAICFSEASFQLS